MLKDRDNPLRRDAEARGLFRIAQKRLEVSGVLGLTDRIASALPKLTPEVVTSFEKAGGEWPSPSVTLRGEVVQMRVLGKRDSTGRVVMDVDSQRSMTIYPLVFDSTVMRVIVREHTKIGLGEQKDRELWGDTVFHARELSDSILFGVAKMMDFDETQRETLKKNVLPSPSNNTPSHSKYDFP